MKSLIVLEKALLEDSATDVREYLSEIDRKTANECFRLLGEHLGLATMEIGGIQYAHLSSASQLLGYTDPSSLAQLLRAYQIMTPKIGWYEVETRTRIRETFQLDEKDSKATFIPYEGILLAGMQGTTVGAKRIKLYLLKAEQVARIGIATVDQLAFEKFNLKRCREIIHMSAKLDAMGEGHFKNVAIEYYEQLTGKTFDRPKQKNLFDR